MRQLNICLALIVSVNGLLADALPAGSALEKEFINPPESSRPWVYWFWLNQNINKEAITADLEAMRRVGVGGVLIMEVSQGVPAGEVKFASEKWREMFKHVVAEADRLGLKVNMNNDAGWTGSGGPWVKPEHAMQNLTWSKMKISGPKNFDGVLPQPKSKLGFYRDVAVLALPDKSPVPRSDILNLTDATDEDGRLKWDAPEGDWTVLRLGYTPTGKQNHPAPRSGLGLECDKMSKEAVEAHFNGFIGKLVTDVGPLEGKTFISTHIDSWEVGSQNWTPRFAEEFRKRRGYDMIQFLPVLAGYTVDRSDITSRFKWDFRQTVSDLVVENYAGHMRELANRHGMRLSIEAYFNTPCDELMYAGRADEPMCEFWTQKRRGHASRHFRTCKEMSSAAHVYGKPILGAEAFTANKWERWRAHPGSIKALGDKAFCEGVNRFVFHRYAMQPWPDRRPGGTMGPWGLHYERTQTWWELSQAWHRYLARCQFLLREGLFAADICYLRPEVAPQGYSAPPCPEGYDFDVCSAEALIQRMSVRNGRLVMPDGMSYRVLVLPNAEAMTLKLQRKIKELTDAGATVIGTPPVRTPGLRNYTRRGETKEKTRSEKMHWIWFNEGNPAHSASPGKRYFRRTFDVAANRKIESAEITMTADNAFELWVNGKRAGAGDNWERTYSIDVASLLKAGVNVLAVEATNATDNPNPTGLIGTLKIKYEKGGVLVVPTDGNWRAAKTVKDNWRTGTKPANGWEKAKVLGPYGMAPWGEGHRSAAANYPSASKVREVLTGMDVQPDFVPDSNLNWIHRRTEVGDIYFVANGEDKYVKANCTFRVVGRMPEIWDPVTGKTRPASAFRQENGRTTVPLRFEPSGSLFVVFTKPTKVKQADGDNFPDFKTVREITGEWKVEFDPEWGGPKSRVFNELKDWTSFDEKGVKYYSGTADYNKTINVSKDLLNRNKSLWLDLGGVHVMARVKLNGKDVGVAWKTPYRVEITDAVKAGKNHLEITVANRWPNRMIGDKFLSKDKRYSWSTWDPFKKTSPLLPSGLIGPVRILTGK